MRFSSFYILSNLYLFEETEFYIIHQCTHIIYIIIRISIEMAHIHPNKLWKYHLHEEIERRFYIEKTQWKMNLIKIYGRIVLH